MTKVEEITIQRKQYPEEPNSNFTVHDLEPFMIWAVEQITSDVTIQSGEEIICDIHGRKYRTTKRKLSRSEVTNLITFIYKSDGALGRLNAGNAVDLPWEIKVGRNKTLRFRVNITTILSEGHKGYSITIRVINTRAPLLEDLNVPQEIIDNIAPKEGLILVVGATGSGKSTLLSSVLDWRLRQPNANLKILTFEAPIEFVYDDVIKPSSLISQSEVYEHLQSFSDAISNALRRKPEVILLGEMRDKETITEAIIAAGTGHLVYSTLHANSVSNTFTRMLNMFQPEERPAKASELISSIQMIISQKLLPSVDGKRIAIREYLVFTSDIKNYLQEINVDQITFEVQKLLKENGQTFLQETLREYNNGKITKKEVREIVQLYATKEDIVPDFIVEEIKLLNEEKLANKKQLSINNKEKNISIEKEEIKEIDLVKEEKLTQDLLTEFGLEEKWLNL